MHMEWRGAVFNSLPVPRTSITLGHFSVILTLTFAGVICCLPFSSTPDRRVSGDTAERFN